MRVCILLFVCLVGTAIAAPHIRTKRTKRQLNDIQKAIIAKEHPKPILDTIREEEKYGNTQTHPIGRAIVSKMETIIKAFDGAVQFPMQAKKLVSDSVIAKLNDIGGRLVGLYKR